MKNSNTSPPGNQPPFDVLAATAHLQSLAAAKAAAAPPAKKAKPRTAQPAPSTGTVVEHPKRASLGPTAQLMEPTAIPVTTERPTYLVEAKVAKSEGLVIQTAQPDPLPEVVPKKPEAKPGRAKASTGDQADPSMPVVPPNAKKGDIDHESREILRYISEDFVMLASGSKLVAYHIQSGDELGKEGFEKYCAKHYGDVLMIVEGGKDDNGNVVFKWKRFPAGGIWWEWNDPARRVVRRIVMEPTSVPENDDNPEMFNRWHTLKHTMAERNPSATADDIAILANHLMYLAGGDVVGVTFFLCWLAQLYQTPAIKMPTAILLYSKYGRVGKNLLYRLLSKVFGQPLVANATGKQLQKNFDDAIEHIRILFINELARSEKVDGYENFKSQISEEDVQFEGKGRASRRIRNITHYVVTTNHEDALPLMEKDGRICVLQCLAERQSDEYYKELVAWIDGPGASALAQILATWKFPADWDPYAPVPQTAATRAMQEASRGALFNNMEQLRLAGTAPFDKDILVVLDVTQALHGHEAMWGCKINTTSVGRVLKDMPSLEFVPMKIEREPPAKDKVVPTLRVYLQPSGIDWMKATPKQRGEHLSKGTRIFAVQPPNDRMNAESEGHE